MKIKEGLRSVNAGPLADSLNAVRGPTILRP
jgi:hypothetical protein